MQPHRREDGICYLCLKLNHDFNPKTVYEHHVIFGGTSGRKTLSEKYGLKVFLCLYHHTAGKEAVHLNHKNAQILQADAQEAFERTFPDLDFLKIFGMNYKGVE